MGRIIQMVWTSEGNCLFLYHISNSGILTFRNSRNIKYLQKEKVTIDKGLIYTNLYFFPVDFLLPIKEEQL